MPKSSFGLNQDFAHKALIAAAPKFSIGAFIEVIDEGNSTETYLFENKQKGYVGWRWSVVIFAPAGQEPTVSEVILMPGEGSLVAPDWVPWSERLADYKALQLELEAQAALEAEEAEELDEVDEHEELDEVEESVEVVDIDEAVEAETQPEAHDAELAATNPEEGENAETKPEKARRKPPRFLRRRKRGAKNQTED